MLGTAPFFWAAELFQGGRPWLAPLAVATLQVAGAGEIVRRLWLDGRLLAPVAHRQVVLTLRTRLPACFLHDRHRLGQLIRVASRTLRAYVQTAVGEREAVPEVIACVQTTHR